jgi:hypothetical protein
VKALRAGALSRQPRPPSRSRDPRAATPPAHLRPHASKEHRTLRGQTVHRAPDSGHRRSRGARPRCRADDASDPFRDNGGGVIERLPGSRRVTSDDELSGITLPVGPRTAEEHPGRRNAKTPPALAAARLRMPTGFRSSDGHGASCWVCTQPAAKGRAHARTARSSVAPTRSTAVASAPISGPYVASRRR